ncbi:E1-E2 ATPase-domain-containing protein [Fusarium flagelliforme]|uniref:Cu2+-exporting atpase n=1 Tax=Fusarium flagelliforme TaxID=2675880 RepID=A0A395N1A3_9HYPO|nr:E1-E2 ATPase-domain-containing protein [Fusarium flagelliforme]KAH7198205.1 E1-E2 ATPase-domain-containing protein [Fusarium flagelliforme]RFN53573.1 cu2+-exporting atpase [Fusarium flagelliforme]
MGCQSGCCGPPAPSPPEPVASQASSQHDVDSCKDSCYGDDRVESEKDKDKDKAIICQADNCASKDCEAGKEETSDDAPDCCRGKKNPCCNSACIDRLAMRECQMSSTTNDYGTGCGSSSSSCDGAINGKPCNKHSVSTLDRYGATLQALGCICRALIAMGQESCCETRDRPAKKSSTRSLLRTSSDSSSSTGPATKKRAVENRLRLRKSSDESVRSDSRSSVRESCVKACCSAFSPNKEVVLKNKSAKDCCGNDTSNAESSVLEQSLAKFSQKGNDVAENLTTNDGCSDVCCSAEREEALAAKNNSITPVANTEASGCSKSCCEARKNKTMKKLPKPGCVRTCCKPADKTPAKSSGDKCAGSCCEKPQSCRNSDDGCCKSVAVEKNPGNETVSTNRPGDIENQTTGKERVVLSISGMTCTGCETKLNRTLATVPSVNDLKTSLVLSRAEFNIDLRLGSVDEVIKHLERTTEFKCERIQTQGSSLDFIVDGNTLEFMGQTWPKGVDDMTVLDKGTVRVSFDPKIVGARDLAGRSWSPPIKLAPPVGDSSLEAGSKHVRHVGYLTLLSAVLTIPVLVMAWAPLPENETAYSSASLALATIVQVVIAGPFYPKAIKALVFSRVIEMDLLIVLSTSAAYIFSVVSFGYLVGGKPLSTGQFFETSTLLVTLVMVGRWVAALARQKAVESISIRSLQVSTAILVDEKSGVEREIDTRLLQYGDVFKVLPDTRIPTDGTVITGSSEVDESTLTGESRPVEKYHKSGVIAGSINGSGVLTVRLNRLPSENTINAIAAMVDEAKLSKPKLQDLADRVASYFVPVVVTLTIVTFAIWVAVGLTVRGYGGSKATTEAITYAIAVLIVSCPCAIGLAVPMVIVIMSGVAAEKGIIFKSADAIEVAHKTSHVVFDKTGTLTRGKLSVVSKECIDEASLPILLGLIENSRHPVSVAVAAHLKDMGVETHSTCEPKSLTGKGLEAVVNGQRLRAGNSRWLNISEHPVVYTMLSQGYTVFCFTVNDELHSVYGLQDELRDDALGTVETLHRRGISVHVVSGDDHEAVHSLAAKLNIPRTNVSSRTSPTGKKGYIQTLLGTDTDRKKPVVVFCGDGTNDAVALAQATIGVHMNEGTDVAQSAADVVLMRPALSGIVTMIDASRKSVNRIKFNFCWSFVYNTFAVLLAAGAFVNARIPPEYAGLGELVSVLPVILAAVLLRWSKI